MSHFFVSFELQVQRPARGPPNLSFRERESAHTHDDYGSPVRAGPTRVKGAWHASGPLEPLTKPRKLFDCSWHRGSFLAGETHVCQPGERKRKIARSVLMCPGSTGLVHVACFAARRRRDLRALPYLFASLKPLAVTRTLMTSKALRNGHRDSQKSPPSPFCFKHLWGKGSPPTCDIDGSFPSSAFAEGRCLCSADKRECTSLQLKK